MDPLVTLLGVVAVDFDVLRLRELPAHYLDRRTEQLLVRDQVVAARVVDEGPERSVLGEEALRVTGVERALCVGSALLEFAPEAHDGPCVLLAILERALLDLCLFLRRRAKACSGDSDGRKGHNADSQSHLRSP